MAAPGPLREAAWTVSSVELSVVHAPLLLNSSLPSTAGSLLVHKTDPGKSAVSGIQEALAAPFLPVSDFIWHDTRRPGHTHPH